MLDTDPKLESVRISGYPSCLAKENPDDSNPLRVIECQMPGCSYAGPNFRDVLYHVSIDHPKDLISCKRCHEKTKLMGHEWCEDCIGICEPEKLTDEEVEEVKKHPRKTSLANEDEKIQAQLEEQKEDETMVKGHGFTLAGKKVCVECKKSFKPSGNRQLRCEKCGAKPTTKKVVPKEKKPETVVKKTSGVNSPEEDGIEKVLYETKPEIIEKQMIDGSTLKLTVIQGKVSGITIIPPQDV
jgi:DNA-directed RNA polymerase subunit RPC12/RpoP